MAIKHPNEMTEQEVKATAVKMRSALANESHRLTMVGHNRASEAAAQLARHMEDKDLVLLAHFLCTAE